MQRGDICPWLVTNFPNHRSDANGAFDLEVVRQLGSRKLGLRVHHFCVLDGHTFPSNKHLDSFSGVAPSFHIKNISDAAAARDVELYLGHGPSVLAFAFPTFWGAPARSSFGLNC